MTIDWYERLPTELYPETSWSNPWIKTELGDEVFYECRYCSVLCTNPRKHLEASKSCLEQITGGSHAS